MAGTVCDGGEVTADLFSTSRVTPQLSHSTTINAPGRTHANDAFSQLLSREVSSVNTPKQQSLQPERSREQPGQSDHEKTQESEKPSSSTAGNSRPSEEKRNARAESEKDDLVPVEELREERADEKGALHAAVSASTGAQVKSDVSDAAAAKVRSHGGSADAGQSKALATGQQGAMATAAASDDHLHKAESDVSAEENSESLPRAAKREGSVELSEPMQTRPDRLNRGKRTEGDTRTTLTGKPGAGDTEQRRELSAIDQKRSEASSQTEREHSMSVSSRSKKDSEGNSLVIDVRDQRRGRAARAERHGDQDARSAGDSVETSHSQRTRPVTQAHSGGEISSDAGDAEFNPGAQSQSGAAVTHGDTRSEAAVRLAQTLRDTGASDIVRQAQIILRNQNEGELRLLLRPDSLGTVRIRMEMVEDRVALRIFVDNETAGEAFRNSIAELQRSFEESGVQTGSVEVTVEDGSQGDSGEYSASEETADQRERQSVGDQYSEREYASADLFGFSGSEHAVNVMA